MQNSLILASGSPRRRELLSLMGITYQICPADVDEHMNGAPGPRLSWRCLAARRWQ